MTLALIAGTGQLPPALVAALRARGDAPLVCEMAGFPSAIDPDLPRLGFRLETLGSFLDTLRGAGVTRVCMAGAMRRPSLDADRIDARTAPLVPRLMAALGQGDDGTLRAFAALFEAHGIAVVGAHEIAPDLLPEPGDLAATPAPPLAAETAAARAALAAMGAADLGQALVVRGGAVIAREDDRGTDAMLADLAAPRPAEGASDPFFGAMDAVGDLLGGAADWLSGRDPAGPAPRGAQAVMFKAPKPGQDRRMDLPVIGPDTAAGAVAAGLAGLVIEAGGVMVLDRPEVVRRLDRGGLFLAVRGWSAGR